MIDRNGEHGTRCAICGEWLPYAGTGRPRTYCQPCGLGVELGQRIVEYTDPRVIAVTSRHMELEVTECRS
jgi:hypothetical protein